MATLPTRLLALSGDRLDTFAPTLDAGEFALWAGWHPRDEADPGHRWLREQLFASAAAEAGPRARRGAERSSGPQRQPAAD